MITVRKILLFCAILVALLVVSAYLLIHFRPGEKLSNPFLSLQADKIDRVIIDSKAEGTAELVKVKNGWEIVKPFHDATDPAIANDVISAFTKIQLSSVISENAGKHAQFKVDADSGVHVQVFLASGTAPAVDGYVGKSAGSYDNCYFRMEGSSTVFIANGMSEYQLRRAPSGYRLTKLMALPPDDPLSITVVQDKKTFHLTRSSATWTVASTQKTVDASLVRPLIEKLRNMNVTDFGTGSEASAALGYEKPYMTVAVETTAGPVGLTFGKKVPAAPKAPATAALRYAKAAGRSIPLIVREDVISELVASIKPLQ